MRSAAHYSTLDSWYEKALQVSGFEVMFEDKWWNNWDTDLRSPHFALVLNIGDMVRGIAEHPEPGSTPARGSFARAEKSGKTIQTLGDYLAFADQEFQRFVDR